MTTTTCEVSRAWSRPYTRHIIRNSQPYYVYSYSWWNYSLKRAIYFLRSGGTLSNWSKDLNRGSRAFPSVIGQSCLCMSSKAESFWSVLWRRKWGKQVNCTLRRRCKLRPSLSYQSTIVAPLKYINFDSNNVDIILSCQEFIWGITITSTNLIKEQLLTIEIKIQMDILFKMCNIMENDTPKNDLHYKIILCST